MRKIYFTYGSETREGFESFNPDVAHSLEPDSVIEIQGQDVLEKVPSLIPFIEACYKALVKDAKAIFSSPHYASIRAWTSPLTKRGISEHSLSFASKEWREATKYTEATVVADFDVVGQFAVEESVSFRAEEVRAFWAQRYNNVAQAILFTLTKK